MPHIIAETSKQEEVIEKIITLIKACLVTKKYDQVKLYIKKNKENLYNVSFKLREKTNNENQILHNTININSTINFDTLKELVLKVYTLFKENSTPKFLHNKEEKLIKIKFDLFEECIISLVNLQEEEQTTIAKLIANIN